MVSVYLQKVLDQVPQILSNQDRDPLSPSYGSFDRKYWGWKYKDFSDATLQCALSPLIQVWDLDVPENPYYHDESLLTWITAGIDFLFKIQHANGGFDQCYPYERAPGNSYELFESVALFLEKAAGELPEARLKTYRDGLKKTCEFTLTHDEDHGKITNHFALYACVSHQMTRFFDDDRFEKKGQALLEKVLSLQSPEGWFLEYDGADAGYETRTFYYLAKLATEFSRNDLLETLSRSLRDFLIYCVHPDGSLGGEYGARNTSLCYPAGFEMLSERFPEAAAVAKHIRKGVAAKTFLSLDSLDPDNLVRLAANYLDAHRSLKPNLGDAPILPFEKSPLDHALPLAGLYFKATPTYYLVMNAHKGGVFRLYDKKSGRLVFNDTSYGALMNDGATISANLLVAHQDVSIGDGTIDLKTRFHKVLQQNMTPLKMIALRIASLSFLKVGFFSRLFSRYVASTLFKSRDSLPVVLHRSLVLNDSSLRITDIIGDTKDLKEIYGTSFSTSIHMASSKYFALGDLPLRSRPTASIAIPKDGNGKREVTIKTDIEFSEGNWKITASAI